MVMRKTYEIDMCNGPLLGKILRFAVPLMFSGILQLLFNAADIVVVGQFTGIDALAAVGSTGSLNNLIVNVFLDKMRNIIQTNKEINYRIMPTTLL